MVERRQPVQQERLANDLVAWLVGRGLLAAHTGVFALGACAMVVLNLLRSPSDLWFWQPLSQWGIVLVAQAAVVGGVALWRSSTSTSATTATLVSLAADQTPRPPSRTTVVISQALPVVRRNVEEALGAIEQNARDLWRRGADSAAIRRARSTVEAHWSARTESPAPTAGAVPDWSGWGWPTAGETEREAADEPTRQPWSGAISTVQNWRTRLDHHVNGLRSRLTNEQGAFPDLTSAPGAVPTPPAAQPEVSGHAVAWPVGQQPFATVTSWPVPPAAVPVSQAPGWSHPATASAEDVVIAGPSTLPDFSAATVGSSDADWRKLEASAASWLARREAETAATHPAPPSDRTAPSDESRPA